MFNTGMQLISKYISAETWYLIVAQYHLANTFIL